LSQGVLEAGAGGGVGVACPGQAFFSLFGAGAGGGEILQGLCLCGLCGLTGAGEALVLARQIGFDLGGKGACERGACKQGGVVGAQAGKAGVRFGMGARGLARGVLRALVVEAGLREGLGEGGQRLFEAGAGFGPVAPVLRLPGQPALRIGQGLPVDEGASRWDRSAAKRSCWARVWACSLAVA
jgi:hypothetical protein